MDTTLQELSVNPWVMLERYFPLNEQGVPVPNLSHIMEDRYKLANMERLINTVAEKAKGDGIANGAQKVVQVLQNGQVKPSSLASTNAYMGSQRSPSGAPPPGN
jgi:hypothetical protein